MAGGGSLAGSAGSADGGFIGTDWVSEQCWLQDLQAAFLYLSSCRWFDLTLRDCWDESLLTAGDWLLPQCCPSQQGDRSQLDTVHTCFRYP